MHVVFVYGTLKRGFANNHLLASSVFVSEATTQQRFPMVIQGEWFSPAMLAEPGEGHCIKGELWRVDDATLERLDELESIGKPRGYHRTLITVTASSGEPVSAHVYLKHRRDLTIIHGEGYADYQDQRYIPPTSRAPSDRDHTR